MGITQSSRRAWQDLPWWTKPVIPLSILVYSTVVLDAVSSLGVLEQIIGFLIGLNILLFILVVIMSRRMGQVQSSIEELQYNE